jgi:hypothetical protein
MRRRVLGGVLAGVGVVVARALAPKLHARLTAGCERMFEQMPETFPPKRMLRGIEEIRASSARTLALLEVREREQGRIAHAASPTRQVAARLGKNEEGELAAAGASALGSDAWEVRP